MESTASLQAPVELARQHALGPKGQEGSNVVTQPPAMLLWVHLTVNAARGADATKTARIGLRVTKKCTKKRNASGRENITDSG